MIALSIGLAVLALSGLAEALHARRVRRVAHLAFGPSGQPRAWTRWMPWLRAVASGLLAWSLVALLQLEPRAARAAALPEGGYRHLVVALDVSPSMQIKDAGIGGQRTRAQRASELLLSILERIPLEQVRVSIVAIYTGAKPVIVDTFDLNVVRNALDDLPLDMAFDIGKTTLIQGIAEAVNLAKPWQDQSTTLIVVSDGDTVPDTGLPPLPRSIARTLVLGVGDPRGGKFIDGHVSRQDASTLRQIAGRLRGFYHEGNEKHLPSALLDSLAQALPMRDPASSGHRRLVLAALTLSSLLLAGIPCALALAGSRWQAGASLVHRPRRQQPDQTQRRKPQPTIVSA